MKEKNFMSSTNLTITVLLCIAVMVVSYNVYTQNKRITNVNNKLISIMQELEKSTLKCDELANIAKELIKNYEEQDASR